jgi:hypothetical protein
VQHSQDELEQLRSRLQRDGYVVLPQRISPSDCQTLRGELDRLYECNNSNYAITTVGPSHLADKAQERVVYNLHNKSKLFWPTFVDPLVLNLIAGRLQEGSWQDSEPFYLNNISARSPNPGSDGQTLHVDSNVPGLNRSLFVNALWCLDNFSPANGTTIVVPGSQTRTYFPETGRSCEDAIAVEAAEGSVIVFEGSLWHAGSSRPETATGSRWGIVLGYARWWIKPSFDTFRNTPLDLYEEMNDELRRILGFDSIPPRTEFERVRRRSQSPEPPIA